MALSASAVNQACEILIQICPEAAGHGIVKFSQENEFLENRILGFDPKADGGMENLCINIRDIKPDQVERFESLQRGICNTPFLRHKMNGITRLGWI